VPLKETPRIERQAQPIEGDRDLAVRQIRDCRRERDAIVASGNVQPLHRTPGQRGGQTGQPLLKFGHQDRALIGLDEFMRAAREIAHASRAIAGRDVQLGAQSVPERLCGEHLETRRPFDAAETPQRFENGLGLVVDLHAVFEVLQVAAAAAIEDRAGGRAPTRAGSTRRPSPTPSTGTRR